MKRFREVKVCRLHAVDSATFNSHNFFSAVAVQFRGELYFLYPDYTAQKGNFRSANLEFGLKDLESTCNMWASEAKPPLPYTIKMKKLCLNNIQTIVISLTFLLL